MATRRLFRADFKANVLLEVISGRKRTSAVCADTCAGYPFDPPAFFGQC